MLNIDRGRDAGDRKSRAILYVHVNAHRAIYRMYCEQRRMSARVRRRRRNWSSLLLPMSGWLQPTGRRQGVLR